MEIPQEPGGLYRHWEKHVQRAAKINAVARKLAEGPERGDQTELVDQRLLKRITEFACERMLVWERRQKSLPAPWTIDPVIQNYRFCNIYRELDKQTIEFHRLLAGLRGDFDLWLLNMFFCRMICRPETVRRAGLISYDEKNNRRVYENLLAVERPRFGNAYVFPVSTILRGEFPTREKFLCFYLPRVMKRVAATVGGFREMNVYDALEKVLPLFGVRLYFLWTEVLIDTAYQYPDLLDLFGRFPIGPGSRPTMKKLNDRLDPEDVCLLLVKQQLKNFPYLTFKGRAVGLSAENWEGIGCEFRKYSNLAAGVGRKRKFSSV